MNAHIYDLECVLIPHLPEAECDCNNGTDDCNAITPALPKVLYFVVYPGNIAIIVIEGYVIIVVPPNTIIVISLLPSANPYPSPTVGVIKRLLLRNPVPLQVYITGGTYKCLNNPIRFMIILCFKHIRRCDGYFLGLMGCLLIFFLRLLELLHLFSESEHHPKFPTGLP